MDHDKTGCQPPPECPVLCINNCGFFGSAATMNMCSKCYKDVMPKQEPTILPSSPIVNTVNKSSTNNGDVTVVNSSVDLQANSGETKPISVQSSSSLGLGDTVEAKPKEGPNRCNTCNKRVGLTGFKCRCDNIFCATHRYSDKHECLFDYHNAAQDAIAKANPVVKAEKLDKI